MKTKYIIIIFLSFLLSSCQEAELPLVNAAKVKVYAEWKDYSFHFSAEVQKAENVKVEEQGFVFVSPQFDNYDSWNDYNKTEEILIVSNKEDFEYYWKRNCPQGLPCEVYAYVKTEYGNFRSETKYIEAGIQATPVITSVRHVVSQSEDWWNPGGTVYIEGANFSDIAYRNHLWVTDETGEQREMALEVVKSSATHIEATYPRGDWKKIGKFPLHLQVGTVDCLSEAYFEVEGTTLVSVEPSEFRYGDEVTLHLERFQASDEFHVNLMRGSVDSSPLFKIISVADNEIKIRVYPQRTEGVSIYVYDKDYNYSPGIPVTIINPWKQIDSYDWQQSFYEYNEYCSYRGKGYVFDEKKHNLKCYDTATRQWTDYPFECEDFNFSYIRQLFGAGNYIYMSVSSYKTDPDTCELKHWQELYRFNLNTHSWEQLNDVADHIDNLIYSNYVLWDESTVYCHSYTDKYLRVYHLDSDTWEDTNVEMPFSELIGEYDGYLYYTTDRRDLYRINPQLPNQNEKVFDGNCFIDNIRGATMQGKYIYFQQSYGMFRIDVSIQPLKLEALGGSFSTSEWNNTHDGMFFLLDDGVYYLNVGRMYKYSE